MCFMAVRSGLRDYSYAELSAATGHFHPLAVIGEGGFGKVYRAMLHLTPCAIKVMDSDSLQGKAEFDNEATLLQRLADVPFLVRLLGTCRDGGAACLVYELLPGGNLEERLACKGGAPPLAWRVRVRIAAQMATALAALHGAAPAPILHRDVKPANILLDTDLEARLADVGLAVRQDAAHLARGGGGGARGGSGGGGEAVGTWSYLAPEYRRDGRLSTKTDTYAFGLVLLQLAAGRDQPQGLVEAAAAAAAEPGAARALDPRAGAWDAVVGERLVRLGLWCCGEAPDARPPMRVVQGELAKLVAAIEAAAAAGGSGGSSNGSGASSTSAQQPADWAGGALQGRPVGGAVSRPQAVGSFLRHTVATASKGMQEVGSGIRGLAGDAMSQRHLPLL